MGKTARNVAATDSAAPSGQWREAARAWIAAGLRIAEAASPLDDPHVAHFAATIKAKCRAVEHELARVPDSIEGDGNGAETPAG